MVDRICEHSFIKRFLNSNSVVINLGAGDGDFAVAISEKYSCLVYSVEPFKEFFDKIPESERIKKINAAVSSKNGSGELFITPTNCPSLYKQNSFGEYKVVNVETVTLPTLIKKVNANQIDLLEMDIEGEEISVLELISEEDLRKVVQLSVEFHDFLYPELRGRVEEIKNRLVSFGFYCIPFSITNNGNVVFIKRGRFSLLCYLFLKYFWRYYLGFLRKVKELF